MHHQTSTDYILSGAGSKVRPIQQERVLPNSKFAAGVQVEQGLGDVRLTVIVSQHLS